jgi:predicted dehydrogenase
VDLSYRHTAAMRAVAGEIAAGRLGEIYHLDLVFHNAYGPDKHWFRDRDLAGGGCLMDLGVHLVDLALWLLGGPDLTCRSAQILAKGRPLPAEGRAVEDFALATLETASGVPIRLSCSWNLPAGCDAVIAVDVHGTEGGASMRNLGGSFYDFEARRLTGCRSEILAAPPDDWGGRAAVDWLERLSRGGGFDPACEELVAVSRVMDTIYRAAGVAR